MSETTKKSFSSRLREETIDIDGKPFTIREMRGTVKANWMNLMSTRMKTGPTGEPIGVKNFAGLHADLITRCVFDSDGKPITGEEVEEWGGTLQEEIYNLCQQINGLDRKSEEDVKNE